MIKLILVLLVLSLATCDEPSNCTRMNFLPMPNGIKCGNENVTISDPCKIFFHAKVQESGNEHVSELIAFQMKKSFHCNIANYVLSPTLEASLIGFDYKVEISFENSELKSVFTT